MNKNGAALIGLLLTCVILAALIYGSSFFWSGDADSGDLQISPSQAIDLSERAKEDIGSINADIAAQNENILDTDAATGTVEATE